MERLWQLTQEQQTILNLAKQGHNIYVLGRAGVGKSTTVQKIKSALEVKGKKVEVVCSTGIACKSYGGIAKTVHSHYGLRVAELPSSLLIERSVGQNDIVKQVADTTVLIWDEISMSSSRILELVNSIHHLIAENIGEYTLLPSYKGIYFISHYKNPCEPISMMECQMGF